MSLSHRLLGTPCRCYRDNSCAGQKFNSNPGCNAKVRNWSIQTTILGSKQVGTKIGGTPVTCPQMVEPFEVAHGATRNSRNKRDGPQGVPTITQRPNATRVKCLTLPERRSPACGRRSPTSMCRIRSLRPSSHPTFFIESGPLSLAGSILPMISNSWIDDDEVVTAFGGDVDQCIRLKVTGLTVFGELIIENEKFP